MGKGRWQPLAANRNHVGLQGQRLEPGNEHGLSEPCAVKSRTHGSSGGKGPQGPYLSQLLHPSLKGVEKARDIVEEWLKGIGLELSPQKTKITHTLTRYEGQVGFDLSLANRAAVPRGQNPLWEKRQRPAPGIQDLHHPKQASDQTARQRTGNSGAYGQRGATGGADFGT
jgi:hypothetical protein